jgi:hypothetical protein
MIFTSAGGKKNGPEAMPTPIKNTALLGFTALFAVTNLAYAQEAGDTIGGINSDKRTPIIEPTNQPKPVKVAKIDTEKFELGAFIGLLNIEDFNTNPVLGISFSYHYKPNILAQINHGRSTASHASFEENSGLNFLASSDYDFTYTELLAGYRVLRGRSFMGKNVKLDSDIYLLAGLSQNSFADNSKIGYSFGASYRTVLTDTITVNIDFKDHIFNREFIGDGKTTHNTELTIGLNILF